MIGVENLKCLQGEGVEVKDEDEEKEVWRREKTMKGKKKEEKGEERERGNEQKQRSKGVSKQ